MAKKSKSEGTRVYGASDDLIEFEGDITGEVGCYGTDDDKHGVLVIMPDGTHLEVKYGKGDEAIWGVVLLKKGTHFDRIEQCENEDDEIYSDIAYFNPGMTGNAYAATEWEKVH